MSGIVFNGSPCKTPFSVWAAAVWKVQQMREDAERKAGKDNDNSDYHNAQCDAYANVLQWLAIIKEEGDDDAVSP